MKILIVDDNIAIQEILGEILTVDGYEIDKVGTVSEAVDKLGSFRPDALILASQVGGESGLKVLDALPSDSDVRAIILTRGKEVIPKDSTFIRGCIQKPFKSDDVTEKVRLLAEEMDLKRSKERKIKFKLFSKQPKTVSDEEIAGARFGKSYVIFENEPSSVYKLAWYFMTKSCNVMVITAGKVKSITERFKNDEGMSVKILGLSVKSRIGYVEMSKLGTVMDQIKKFVVENDKPVIVFDDMEPIIDTNGLNNVMTMLYQILNGAVKKTSSLVVSTGENSLTDKDKELFLHDMERYIA
jgi:CheY-like chemotaxis protein